MASLIAGLSLVLASSTARAGFTFQINAVNNGMTGDGFKIEELPNGSFKVVAPQGGTLVNPTTFTATGNVIKGTATIDGTTFTFRATSNQDSATSTSQAVVTTNITATNNSGSTEKFGYFVSDNSFAAPSSTRSVQSKTQSLSDYTPGAIVYSQAVIGGVAKTNNTNLITGPNQTQTSNLVPVTINNQYALANVGGVSHLLPGATAHFLSSASFAMPEPTGVLLALLGLPCMVGLVVWARRRPIQATA